MPGADVPVSEHHLDASGELHRLEADALLALFENQDRSVLVALAQARPSIARLGDAMAQTLAAGGRVVYAGAGTSGRLGALDAAEWPPTFGVDPARVVAVVAGGDAALRAAVEDAEDDEDAARSALDEQGFTRRDLLVGISASGRTPYVRSALGRARELGAGRALVTTDPNSPHPDPALIAVVLETGPELVAGSTRLKAAAATHAVLQRASMVCAVASGWVHAGHMVEMRPTNAKLRRRAVAMVMRLGDVGGEQAAALLERSDGDIKVALVGARHGLAPAAARAKLAAVGRRLDRLL